VLQVQVDNFTYGLVNPVLGYAMSCLGAFLGLRCIIRARAYSGAGRAVWLSLAAVALGTTGIWLMHFIAMLGYTIPGQLMVYSVPITLISMLLAVLVVGIGLFIVGYSDGGSVPVLAGGLIIGIGVATMHYVGMSAMRMPGDVVRYNDVLVAASVLIAIVAGTAALWAGLRVRGNWSTLGAALVMGVAVSGMHYTGMAAMHVYMQAGSGNPMTTMPGLSAEGFLLPLLLGVSILTFLVTLLLALAPSEEEIREDTLLTERLHAGAR
jgi:NO-binding membrane sensor protein with MHYT domain